MKRTHINPTASNPSSKPTIYNRSSFWGVALILGGVYLFLQNLGVAGGIVGAVMSLFWSMGFGVGAIILLSLFASDPVQRWWAAIPGFIFGGLASIALIEEFIPIAEPITGPLFLGSIGAAFVMIFLFNHKQWWAVIPAGVLTSLAIVAGIDEIPLLQELIGVDTGAIFLIGLSLTFLAVATLPVKGENMSWAFIPSGVLMVIALASETDFGDAISTGWPLVLIIGGSALIWCKFVDNRNPLLRK